MLANQRSIINPRPPAHADLFQLPPKLEKEDRPVRLEALVPLPVSSPCNPIHPSRRALPGSRRFRSGRQRFEVDRLDPRIQVQMIAEGRILRV